MALLGEWEIENFSCWSGDIHGDRIEFDFITLYPRGVGRIGEYMELKRTNWKGISELSFIGSDGSVIYTLRPDADSPENKIFTGPKFGEVVAEIKRNEPIYKDRLILRWKRPQGGHAERLRTVLDAYSAIFYLKPEVLDLVEINPNRGIPKKLKLNDWKSICYISFDDSLKPIIVSACKEDSTLGDTKIKFKMVSRLTQKLLAQTSIWMLNGDNIVQKREDDCILLKQGGDIQLCYQVPLKELQGLAVIMCCKITGQSFQKFRYMADFPLSHDVRITGFSRPCEKIPLETAVTALAKDLTCLYQEHDFSDFEVRCRTISFATHRGILSARSPVLKAMLSMDMREAASGYMDIKDLDPHTLGRFLAFLYSGTIGEDLEWEGALQLYYAADKYQVPSLKEECTAVLRANVSLENVCDILLLADVHQELKSATHDFILRNFNDVLGSEKWQKLLVSDPLLVANTVTDIGKKKMLYFKENVSH